MIPKTTSRTCDYTIQTDRCQLQLCQPRINLAITGVDVSLLFFFFFFNILNVESAKHNLLTNILLFIYLSFNDFVRSSEMKWKWHRGKRS